MPTCHVARSSAATSKPASGLRGARFVAKTRPWTDEVERPEDDVRAVGREDHEAVRVGRQPASAGEVVGAVDRRAVVDVVGARDQRPSGSRRRRAAELGGDPLDRAARLGVRVEQVAGDEDEVDLLREGEVDGGPEGRELALALGGRLLAEVGVAGPEMDVGRVEQAEHRRHCARSDGARGAPDRGARPRGGPRPSAPRGDRQQSPVLSFGQRNRCAPREVRSTSPGSRGTRLLSPLRRSRVDGAASLRGRSAGCERTDLEEQHP